MEKALKILLRVYPLTRNWMTLSNYIAPLQSVQNASQMYSTDLSDYTQSKNVTKLLTGRNSKYNTRRVVEEPMTILNTAAINYKNMSLRDTVDSLSALFIVSKRMQNLHDIENHKGFEYLCATLSKSVRLLKIPDVLETLKALIHFKVPSYSYLIQSLLQMIRGKINEMSLHEIIFTSFILNKMETTPLRDALLIALPLVFEAQLPTKLDSDNIYSVISSYRYIIEYKIQNTDIYDIILKSFRKHEQTLDLHAAKLIFNNLDIISQLPMIDHKILCKAQDILTLNVKKLNTQDIVNILKNLSKHQSMLYNEAFVNSLVNSALSFDIDYTKATYMLKSLNYLNHAHVPLLEHLAAKCFENPTLLKEASYDQILAFLKGLINADYKPLFWNTIKEAIINTIINTKIDNRSNNRSFIRFTLYLIALDCYNPYLINKVFSIPIKINEPLRNIYGREILVLYQSIKTLYSMYDGPWPQQDFLEYAMNEYVSPTHSLKSGLEQALGGPQYVHHDLKTKLGHHIEHVIVMRKGGYPIAINTDTPSSRITYIEDLQTPSESQMIFIFNLPNYAYAANSRRLKSTWVLKIKSTEALTKCNTVCINSSYWIKLPTYERVPYLMQAIKLKCEDLLASRN